MEQNVCKVGCSSHYEKRKGFAAGRRHFFQEASAKKYGLGKIPQKSVRK